MPNEITVKIQNIEGTRLLGEVLAQNLQEGSVIALIGTLGAGKTTLVQAVAEHLGVEPGTVSSPTFVLLHEYDGEKPIYHFDAYRLSSSEEFLRLGPDDYFEGDGLTFVEWADKFPDVLPENHVEIRIEIKENDERLFKIVCYGSQNFELEYPIQSRMRSDSAASE